MKLCKISNCNTKIHARDLCVKHYWRFMKYGDPQKTKTIIEHNDKCTVIGCNKPFSAKNFCKTHYERMRIYGRLEKISDFSEEEQIIRRVRRNYIGMKFGMLTIISYTKKNPNEKGTTFVNVKCDCGRTKTTRATFLFRNITKSCGCRGRLTGVESSKNQLYKSYVKGAEKRDIDFQLSREDFYHLILQNCHYCGIPPSKSSYHLQRAARGHFLYNGIDRKNNEIGYTKENSVSCCYNCNVSKNSRTYDEFINYLEQITKFRTKIII